jgi:CheY-like chemotaxis protein/anti-sigma regulatory factor (Ser/Thr protein kinase)
MSPRSAVKPRRVLVVDDDRATRLLLEAVLSKAGFSTTLAEDGVEALTLLRRRRFDLLVLDVWMPRMTGLDLLARLRTMKRRPRVVVTTSDDTPATVLAAVREQAVRYVKKPVVPQALIDTLHEVLDAPEIRPIDVISARPEWVELVVPCTREAAERIQSVMARLDTDLPLDLRESIASSLRELVMNAIEWGGQLDPDRSVRIAYLRARRMLMYRIADPGSGFDIDNLPHSAISYPAGDPTAHMMVREEKGIRPGGFGLMMVRASADELLYNEKRNEVVFIKYLDEAPDTRED